MAAKSKDKDRHSSFIFNKENIHVHNTPKKKSQSNSCVICGSTNKLLFINSETRQNKLTKDLLWTYINIKADSGMICRSCDGKLLRAHKILSELKQSSCKGSKRLAETPEMDRKKALTKTPEHRKSLSFNPHNTTFVPILPKPSIKPDSCSVIQNRIINSSNPANKKSSISTNKETKNEDILSQPIQKSMKNAHIKLSFTSDHSYSNEAKSTKKSQKTAVKDTSKALPPPSEDHIYGFMQNSLVKKVHHSKIAPIVNQFKAFDDICKSTYPSPSAELKYLFCGSLSQIALTIIKMPKLRQEISRQMALEMRYNMEAMYNSYMKEASILLGKDYDTLKSFSWHSIVSEMSSKFPDLTYTLMKVMVGDKIDDKVCNILPRLGMIYAIMSQGANMQLSQVQNVLTATLLNDTCEVKVYDQLNKLGVSLSYSAALNLQEKIALHFLDELRKVVANDDEFFYVGDNVNWKTGVSHKTLNHREKMFNGFAVVAIVQLLKYLHLSDEPQKPPNELCPDDLLLTTQEWDQIMSEHIVVGLRDALKHLPTLQFLEVLVKPILGPYAQGLAKKSTVIPLFMDEKDENKVAHCVDLLDRMESILTLLYGPQILPFKKIPVGGDQLTVERFLIAFKSRLGGVTPAERFDHLGPVHFSLFHLMMKLLEHTLRKIYSKDHGSIGTLKAGADILGRTSANFKDPHKAYSPTKDITLSYGTVIFSEALMDYFGMADTQSAPTRNIPGENPSVETLKRIMKGFTDKYIPKPKMLNGNIIVDGAVLNLRLLNGQNFPAFGREPEEPERDYIQNHATQVLEMTLLLKNWFDTIKNPNRERGLRLMKYSMAVMREINPKAKYPYEITRFLTYQYCASPRMATKIYYGLTINTKGLIDSHIPADERMEIHVKKIKKPMKRMFSGKTDKNVQNKTCAFSGLSCIAENLAEESDVIVRTSSHPVPNAIEDEQRLLEDVRQVRPFEYTEGRFYPEFRNKKRSVLSSQDLYDYRKWLREKIKLFGRERGNLI